MITGRYDAGLFAEYVNNIALEKGLEVNFTRIQKWLYICYGLYLVDTGDFLLKEKPEAWVYGPFFPSVHELQHLGLGRRNQMPGDSKEDNLKLESLVTEVLDVFGDWTACQLIAWVSEEGTAWYKQYKRKKRAFAELNNTDILIDFKKIVID